MASALLDKRNKFQNMRKNYEAKRTIKLLCLLQKHELQLKGSAKDGTLQGK
jgi:hypothetical protein